jgi:hypothetical protein
MVARGPETTGPAERDSFVRSTTGIVRVRRYHVTLAAHVDVPSPRTAEERAGTCSLMCQMPEDLRDHLDITTVSPCVH